MGTTTQQAKLAVGSIEYIQISGSQSHPPPQDIFPSHHTQKFTPRTLFWIFLCPFCFYNLLTTVSLFFVLTPLQNAVGRFDSLLDDVTGIFDSPLQNAAARFDSPLHHVAGSQRFLQQFPLRHPAGSQTSIQITPRILNQI